ncbi:MAG: substrate-binding domain-containing protein [Candidatus Poseidonia sp.]|nr:substrate-binding domain-containing protein [Poseidonia sp.]MBL6806814.1 substrate-binding domain-containing protein [Poseidonia sp.]MBL6885082.1 substrate-binding domain-containing protein [Candidatus Poseidoniaceae archaeon]MBL6886055.1 substrate-binding domain-containing protein [Poseidonia sp.]
MDFKVFFATLLLLPLSGCFAPLDDDTTTLRLATTTSMRDSGLLDILVADFEQQHDLRVEYVAVGTGAALELGENKDVDALIVHAPEQETTFIEQGFGTERTLLAWNSFVLLSPMTLPGQLEDAFFEIQNESHCFISRGDFSGTHQKEQDIWRQLNQSHDVPLTSDSNGVHPSGDWYRSIGQGMGAAINMAHEKNCITLSDRGTALHYEDKVTLDRFEYDDEILYNPYSFISITDRPAGPNTIFLDYLTKQGKDIIANYTIGGEPAFFVPS